MKTTNTIGDSLKKLIQNGVETQSSTLETTLFLSLEKSLWDSIYSSISDPLWDSLWFSLENPLMDSLDGYYKND